MLRTSANIMRFKDNQALKGLRGHSRKFFLQKACITQANNDYYDDEDGLSLTNTICFHLQGSACISPACCHVPCVPMTTKSSSNLELVLQTSSSERPEEVQLYPDKKSSKVKNYKTTTNTFHSSIWRPAKQGFKFISFFYKQIYTEALLMT